MYIFLIIDYLQETIQKSGDKTGAKKVSGGP